VTSVAVTTMPVGRFLRDVTPESEPHWRDLALCAEIDPAIFFPEKGESAKPAKAVCAVCPSRLPCREYALGRDELGVWGGMSRIEREREQQQREAAAA